MNPVSVSHADGVALIRIDNPPVNALSQEVIDGISTAIDAVARDGIQLKVRARVTVRTNIKGLVGGATEETIIARVGEGAGRGRDRGRPDVSSRGRHQGAREHRLGR